MIGPRLKACLFVIGRREQSSLPPSSQRHSASYTHTYTHTYFPFRPLSSPLRRSNQDGIKQLVVSYCIWMNAIRHSSINEDGLPAQESEPSAHLSPDERTEDWSGDLLVTSLSPFYYFFPSVSVCLFLFAISVWAYIQCFRVM